MNPISNKRKKEKGRRRRRIIVCCCSVSAVGERLHLTTEECKDWNIWD
jgi:hypothetical protein